MLFSQLSNIRRTRFDQSSPVQPVSESRGGPLSMTEEDGGGRSRKSSCLIWDVKIVSMFKLPLKAYIYVADTKFDDFT